MHGVLGEALGIHALIYIDDILVYSRTFEEHIQHLDDVFERLRAANLSCSLPKSQLFKEEVKYLGHMAGARGTYPDPAKVEAMLDMSPPLDANGRPDLRLIQVFEGVWNYYRRYLKGYAGI